MPRSLAAAIAVPAAAQLACTPVIVAVFGQVAPLAIPANLLAAPAVAPATLLGLIAALLSQVSSSTAAMAAWLGAWPVAWLAFVARTLSALPGAGLTVPTGWSGLALLAGFATVVGGVVGAVRRRRRRGMLAACRP
jgi:competence protein ComEC